MSDIPVHHGDPTDEQRRRLLALLPALALTGEASAQDPAKLQPSDFHMVLENEHVRVIMLRSRPGLGVCGVGMHSHPAHLTIALGPVKTRIKLPDGKTFVGQAQLGDVFWSEAETHETENIGGKDALGLIVELKPSGAAKA